MKTEFILIIVLAFVVGAIAGWFLHPFIKGYKISTRPSFKFFHKDKLYNFDDASVLLDWSHGMDRENNTYLVRFPDGIYFRIEFHNYGVEPDVEEYSKDKMIDRLKNEVKSSPKVALTALKLIEA
jgi:hypothetical protein